MQSHQQMQMLFALCFSHENALVNLPTPARTVVRTFSINSMDRNAKKNKKKEKLALVENWQK